MRVVFDADGLIAWYDPGDYHHKRTKVLMQRLSSEKANYCVPVTAACEAITMFQKGKGKKVNGEWQWERRPKPHLAELLVGNLQTRSIHLHMLDEDIIMEAFRRFNPEIPGDTMYDAIVAAIARCKHMDAIFSFDHWFKEEGFTLVSDYFKVDTGQA
jgi:predicted nucleic acid-binding protein